MTATGPHGHVFLGEGHARGARATAIVVAITLATMAVEIGAGIAYGSAALLADGVHMGTHAGALLVAAIAYRYASCHAEDPRFTLGTGKMGALAAFTSALILAVAALAIGVECAGRLVAPVAIEFGPALVVAAGGLAVNLVCAYALWDGSPGGHGHGHDDGHGHEHGHGHHAHGHGAHDRGAAPADPAAAARRHQGQGAVTRDGALWRDDNRHAAYLHVLADALTSVLAIAGLVGAWVWGLAWLDAAVGLVGAAMIARWAWGMLRTAGATLLDCAADPDLARAIARAVERPGTRVVDLHLWRLGPGHLGLMLAVESDAPAPPAAYKARLAHLPALSHVTVEVNPAARG